MNRTEIEEKVKGFLVEDLEIDGDKIVPNARLKEDMAIKEALNEANIVPSSTQCIGFVSGTTVGGMDMTEQHYLDFFEKNDFDHFITSHGIASISRVFRRAETEPCSNK